MSLVSEEKQRYEHSQIFHFNSSEAEQRSVSWKKNSMVSVVRVFILIVLKVKQRSERNQRFPFNSSEVKQCNECIQ